MADDMDSDTCVGSKRRGEEIEATQTFPQRSDFPSPIREEDSHSSEIVSPLKQDQDFIDKSPSFLVSDSKKVKFSPDDQVSETHLQAHSVKACGLVSEFCASAQDFEENCQMGFEKESLVSDLVDKKRVDSVGSEVGLAGIQKFIQETKSVNEADCKEDFAASLSTALGKETGSENLLDVKKKQLLAEVEAILVPAEKKVNNTTKIGYPGLQSSTDAALTSLKVEVIDETALIESVSIPKPCSGRGNELGFLGHVAQRNGNKNAKQEANGKKARNQRRKEKLANGKPDMVGVHSQCVKNGTGAKITYSRMEMEAMRFVNLAEQRKLWKDVYNGLGPVVAREYDDLAISKHQKNIHINSDHRKRFGKMEEAPGNLGESLGNLVNSETQDVSLLDPVCSYNVTNEDGYPFPEKEYSEDDDSDEEYASIQRPAFLVEGEPNFDSGSPEDGFEYLRRVRWEAAQIPKVRVAKLDRSKFNREQSDYMPKIPEIAKCPEQFLPVKQWEDAFLSEFSKLRLVCSHPDSTFCSCHIFVSFEGSNANTSQDWQSKVLHEKFCSHQPPVDIIFENFSNDCSILGNCNDQPSLLTAEVGSASPPVENFSPKASVDHSSRDSPLLSVILRLDSVARVSIYFGQSEK
ncbi:hypothetical protein M0R45_001036 [Rubus argutus]|uniref:Uncharacterized protein n=1 Tax=Rubus argutus TaxID=59490 RepID=A0AAW1VK84_RUBAR